MSHPLAARLKRGRRIMRGGRASRRHEKQDECYVETCEVLMILPHPLARDRISMAPHSRCHIYDVEIDDAQK